MLPSVDVTDTSPWQAVAEALATRGFSRFNATLFDNDGNDHKFARTEFMLSCTDLPPDPYARTPGRNRRYGLFVWDTSNASLHLVSPALEPERGTRVAYYYQPTAFNPEHGGRPRAFAALTEAQSTNRFLLATLRNCFHALPWTAPGPVFIGVHVVEFEVKPGQNVTSSPAKLHRDGEPFTWAFLLHRQNVCGAENIIATADVAGNYPCNIEKNSILASFTLEQAWDGWVVDDARVSHYVSEASIASGASMGRRTALLIDYSPAVPEIVAKLPHLRTLPVDPSEPAERGGACR
jgi:hypothetical protein